MSFVMPIMNSMITRKATDADSSLIKDLIFNIWINEYHFDVRVEDFPDLIQINKYYHQSAGAFLVVIFNAQIIGTIACQQLTNHQFVLKRMFIHQQYRKLGIAQHLLNTLFAQMVYSVKNLKSAFFLSTKEKEAIAAKEFYLKNNFQVISKSALPIDFPFFYQDDLFMMRNTW